MDLLGCCKLCTYYIEKKTKNGIYVGSHGGRKESGNIKKKSVNSMHTFYATLSYGIFATM